MAPDAPGWPRTARCNPAARACTRYPLPSHATTRAAHPRLRSCAAACGTSAQRPAATTALAIDAPTRSAVRPQRALTCAGPAPVVVPRAQSAAAPRALLPRAALPPSMERARPPTCQEPVDTSMPVRSTSSLESRCAPPVAVHIVYNTANALTQFNSTQLNSTQLNSTCTPLRGVPPRPRTPPPAARAHRPRTARPLPALPSPSPQPRPPAR